MTVMVKEVIKEQSKRIKPGISDILIDQEMSSLKRNHCARV
jgi:hypothetical protein